MKEAKYKKLSEELHQRGMNVNQLSMQTKITASGLYAAIKGTTPFWPKWRRLVAEALDMDEAELFGEEEE